MMVRWAASSVVMLCIISSRRWFVRRRLDFVVEAMEHRFELAMLLRLEEWYTEAAEGMWFTEGWMRSAIVAPERWLIST